MKFNWLFSTLVTSFVFSSTTLAAPPQQFNYSKLNLLGIEILDVDGIDTFGQKLKRMPIVPSKLKAELELGSNSKIVSPVFELAKPAVGQYYRNVYLYVGRVARNRFEFVQAIVTKNGAIFTMDIEMTDVRRNEITIVRGPSSQRRTLTVTSRTNPLLP